MEEKQLYTVSIYTENNIGLLNRISAIFQRRHINVESINTSASEIEGVSRFTLVVNITETQVKKIIGQLEKQVEVIKAYYHTDDETIYQESVLFKIKSDLLFEERQIQNIIKESNARIVTVNKEFFVLEKSGRKSEVELLYRELSVFGIMQFVRSGRIAVTKDEMKISEMLAAFNIKNINMANYFNTLSLRDQLAQLGKCRFMESSEFENGVEALKGKKIAIVGCGAQGLNQGLEHERF